MSSSKEWNYSVMFLLDLTRPFNKNFPAPSLGLLLNFKPISCIKSLALIVLGATLVKLEVRCFLTRKKEHIYVKIFKTGSNIAAQAW
mgnify:CR=1 FL=1